MSTTRDDWQLTEDEKRQADRRYEQIRRELKEEKKLRRATLLARLTAKRA